MAWKKGKKVTVGGKTRVVKQTKRGKLYVIINKTKRYSSQSKTTGAKRGRPKGSTKKTTVKRTPSGRGRGRPKMSKTAIPSRLKVGNYWFRKKSTHSSKKAALRAAPAQHRIRKMAGRYVLYTRNR